ncbi:hypothetical protein HELRODRAFT_182570 [Helobdella robusta]|uniref:C-type lectin domain-containing protein n=1 Tax=Helobdella robusta TaxID=6412 RepID=T1FID4_HELRO|nr:hypothetical protein HELRODRAFT_182570 [Helobdella robusta]ESN90862.1 hypothetical protein HELRODRAFT_182570 [Helobdella robusta]
MMKTSLRLAKCILAAVMLCMAKVKSAGVTDVACERGFHYQNFPEVVLFPTCQSTCSSRNMTVLEIRSPENLTTVTEILTSTFNNEMTWLNVHFDNTNNKFYWNSDNSEMSSDLFPNPQSNIISLAYYNKFYKHLRGIYAEVIASCVCYSNDSSTLSLKGASNANYECVHQFCYQNFHDEVSFETCQSTCLLSNMIVFEIRPPENLLTIDAMLTNTFQNIYTWVNARLDSTINKFFWNSDNSEVPSDFFSNPESLGTAYAFIDTRNSNSISGAQVGDMRSCVCYISNPPLTADVVRSALNFASDGKVVMERNREFQRKRPEKAKADLAKECLTGVKKKLLGLTLIGIVPLANIPGILIRVRFQVVFLQTQSPLLTRMHILMRKVEPFSAPNYGLVIGLPVAASVVVIIIVSVIIVLVIVRVKKNRRQRRASLELEDAHGYAALANSKNNNNNPENATYDTINQNNTRDSLYDTNINVYDTIGGNSETVARCKPTCSTSEETILSNSLIADDGNGNYNNNSNNNNSNNNSSNNATIA